MNHLPSFLVPRILCLISILFITACGGSQKDPVETVAARCESIQYSTIVTQSLKPIRASELSGLFAESAANENNPIYIKYRSTDSVEPLELVYPLFTSLEQNSLVLDTLAPLHPLTPFVTTHWQTSLVAGDQLCNGPEITVTPLDSAAPETLDLLAEQMQQWLVLRAKPYNILDWNELIVRMEDFIANGTDASIGLLQLFMATEYATVFMDKLAQADTAERALMAALFANSGSGGILQANIDHLTAVPFFDQTPTDSIFTTAANRRAQKTNGVCAAITGEPVYIGGEAIRLSEFMQRQSEVEEDLKSNFGKAEEATLALAPFIALASGPIGAGVSAFVFVDKTVREYDSNALPSYFIQMEVELDPGSEVPEDYEAVFGNELSWKNAQVWATSKGMNLSGPTLDALMMGIGAIRTANTIAGAEALLNPGTVSNAYNFFDNAKGVIQDNIEGSVFNKIKEKLNFDCLELKPHTWGPINVSDEQWTEDSLTGSALALGARLPNARALTLKAIGQSNVKVSVIPEKFGGEAFNKDLTINVNKITLTANPKRLNVEVLGEHKTVSVYVENTAQPELAPVVQHTLGIVTDTDAPQSLGGSLFELGYTTPTDLAHYPATITFTRPAALPTLEPRSSSLEIISAPEIGLSPTAACLLIGNTKTFTATLTGFDANTPVVWKLLSGVGSLSDFSLNGTERYAVYNANAKGLAVIEVSATDSEGAAFTSTANITIGACVDLYVTGDYSFEVRAINNTAEFAKGEETFPPPLGLPVRPAYYWKNRSEIFDTPALSVNDVSDTYALEATGNGTASYIVDGDGNVAFNNNMLNAADQCENTGDADIPVACSTAETLSSIQLNYYIDVNAAQQYDLNITASCSRSGDSYAALVPAAALIYRFEGGAGDPGAANPPMFDPENPPDLTGLTPQEIFALLGGPPYLENTLVPFVEAGNVCTSANGGFTSIHEVINLAAPTAEGTTDLVYFSLLFITKSGLNHFVGYDLSNYFDGYLQADVAVSGTKAPGNYSGNADLNVSVSLLPKTN